MGRGRNLSVLSVSKTELPWVRVAGSESFTVCRKTQIAKLCMMLMGIQATDVQNEEMLSSTDCSSRTARL